MATYASANVASQIAPLLQKIQETGQPGKVETDWLARIGFTKSTDRSLIGVLKHIGFIDSSGVPSQRWQSYRNKQAARRVLAEAIHDGYPDLFETYSDAYQRSEEDLKSFFASNTEVGGESLWRIFRTFQTLCSLADFSDEAKRAAEEDPPQPETPTQAAPSETEGRMSRSQPTLHIDLQIHISPEASTEQIDQIFASMAKHLYGK